MTEDSEPHPSTPSRIVTASASRRKRWIDYPRHGKRGIRRWLPSWRQVALLCLTGIALVAGLLWGAYQAIEIPDANEELRAQTTVVTFADGRPIARLFEQDRTNVDLDQVPVHMREAVLSAENRGFYTDPGISVTGAARALWVTLTSDEVQGGSTITQQYVKNMYLTQERSWERKIKEVFISLKIDREMTKDDILEDYLNTIYFGRGAYGVQAAAQAYYGKNSIDLTVSESALLAARIQDPVAFDSADRADELEARWEYVLDGMVTEGWLSSSDRAAQTYPALRDESGDVRFGGQAGYVIAATQSELTRLGFTEEQVQRGGLRVRTTFEPKAQAAAEAAIASQLPAMAVWPDNFHAALAAVRPGTGEVVAIYGGRGYQEGAFFNDAIQGAAQPGSTFKPFALTAALENGVSLRDRFNGADDREFPEYDGGRPVPNFGGASYGFINLITATANSVNTAYVDLTIDVGPEKVVETAARAGIPADTQDLLPRPSVVLGVANVHPVDLANSFATFAAGGERAAWHVVSEVLGPDGEVLYTAAPTRERVFSPEVMADVSYALQAVVEDGSGQTAQELGRPSAGKTGTTNDNRSAWYAGYVPQLSATVALWEEGADASLSGFGGRETVTGGSFPASVWTAFMTGALEGTEVVEFPEVTYVNEGSSGGSDDDSDNDNDGPAPPPDDDETPDPTQAPTATATAQPTLSASNSPQPPPTSEGPDPTASPTSTREGTGPAGVEPDGRTAGLGGAAVLAWVLVAAVGIAPFRLRGGGGR